MALLFISYSRSDRPFLDNFVLLLRRVYGNDSLWYDDDIHGGADWWQMILDEIAACDLFIYLISNEALESAYCQAELREALRLKKQILPVIVRRLNPPYPGTIGADLSEVLRRTQYVDISGGFKDANTTASLYAAVHRLLKQVPQQSLPSVTSQPIPQPTVPDKPKSAARIKPVFILVMLALVVVISTGIFVFRQGMFATSDNITPTSPVTTTAAQMAVERSTQSTEPLALTPMTSNIAWTPVQQDFDGVTMVLVPTGCFMMGSTEGDADEEPVHRQCLETPYWIDRTEVTQADFDRVGGIKAQADAFEGDRRPVENITWFEAYNYCEERGARLPTEREWEYAARGPDSLVYPWGNEWGEDYAVWVDIANDHTANVGSLSRDISWIGAKDLTGNVWEWTSSIYESYPYDTLDGREEFMVDSTDIHRVARGGSWRDNRYNLRAPFRMRKPPSEFGDDLGFRCVHSAAATATLMPEQLALTPVTSNAAWTPVERDFDGVTMMLVPAGSFEMGSTSAQIDAAVALCQQAADEGAVCERSFFEAEHIPSVGNRQTLTSFWIDQTEVTRQQYQRCVDADVCEAAEASEFSTEPDQPVNNINWFQAQAYCEWRGARLPTEVEWEYAARGTDGWVFPWGDEFDGTRANHCDSNCGEASWASGYLYVNEENDDHYAVTAPVGSYPSGASWVGALDMSGNLWEWTSSQYESYPYEATDGREQPTDVLRVLRGGSFEGTSSYLRSAYRNGGNPINVDDLNGFRCVRSP
jgi:formylglycine-generating enzyme required for sulfatase activity